jgi:hypothetical protein
MDRIEGIQERFQRGRFEFSKHALDQTLLRSITIAEIRQAVARARIIEDYPDDKYGPSCLLLGYTEVARPLHVHCSYPERDPIKLITVYEPDPARWVDFATRRPQS